MSGKLASNFRKGNLSEIIADYLLSSIGISTPVRRQDDIGFDFYCQLADQETGPILTFGSPFIIQIKSDSEESIVYGNSNADKWRNEDIAWLFKLEWPFFIGVVYKNEISIKIYRTTNIWFPLYENFNCSQIELSFPNVETNDEAKRPEIIKLENWPAGKGDGFKYKVALGNPILSISYQELENIQLIRERKNILRNYIELELKNIMFRKQGIRHFQWVPMNKTNQSFSQIAVMFYGIYSHDISSEIYNSINPGLLSLLFQLSHHKKDAEELTALKSFMRLLPNQEFYKQFKSQYPEAFDWVEA